MFNIIVYNIIVYNIIVWLTQFTSISVLTWDI